MKHFWSLVLLLTAFMFLKSEGQEISGRISDKLTNETLIGVNILLNGKGIASSDFDGNFSISTSKALMRLFLNLLVIKKKK